MDCAQFQSQNEAGQCLCMKFINDGIYCTPNNVMPNIEPLPACLQQQTENPLVETRDGIHSREVMNLKLVQTLSVFSFLWGSINGAVLQKQQDTSSSDVT